MSLFLKVLGLIFIAELGDKTQFLMIAMASRYRIGEILAGTLAAILTLNGIAIGLGLLMGGVLPTAVIGIVAGLAFLWFAYSALEDKEEKDEKEEEVGWKGTGKRSSVLTVFGTFFLAELGDKTQLTVLALAAGLGEWRASSVLAVLLGASLALLAADLLGLLVGYFLGKALPQTVFARISFGIFALFGIVKLLGGLEEAFASVSEGRWYAIGGTVAVGAVFAYLSIRAIIKREGSHEQTKQSKNRKSLSVDR